MKKMEAEGQSHEDSGENVPMSVQIEGLDENESENGPGHGHSDSDQED
jgi:hypothetical protein